MWSKASSSQHLHLAHTCAGGLWRSVPGATPLMITSLFATAYAAGSLLETASLDLATKIFWYSFQAVIQFLLRVVNR